MCKRVYATETWIGEVHLYEGFCPSCITEKEESDIPQESVEDNTTNNVTVQSEENEDKIESNQSSPIEIEKAFLSNLAQKADEVISGQGSINVLIKEIKDGLVDKAKERIEESIQSFDVSRIEAQKIIDYAEETFDYILEYKDYIDGVVKKLQDKPKMKVKTAIEKIFKDTMANLPKDIAKDVLLNKKATLKTVYEKAVDWYSIYSDTEDVTELTKKMTLHPFTEIQKKLGTLPFYS